MIKSSIQYFTEFIKGSSHTVDLNDHYRKLERMYLQAHINQQHYPTTAIQIEDGVSTISVELDDSYHHALGAAHGSVYFKLLDDAAFFAGSSKVLDRFILTTSFNLHFIRPVASGIIRAEGAVRHQSRETLIAEATLFNEAGKEIGFGSGHFAKSKMSLSPEIGYV